MILNGGIAINTISEEKFNYFRRLFFAKLEFTKIRITENDKVIRTVIEDVSY